MPKDKRQKRNPKRLVQPVKPEVGQVRFHRGQTQAKGQRDEDQDCHHPVNCRLDQTKLGGAIAQRRALTFYVYYSSDDDTHLIIDQIRPARCAEITSVDLAGQAHGHLAAVAHLGEVLADIALAHRAYPAPY